MKPNEGGGGTEQIEVVRGEKLPTIRSNENDVPAKTNLYMQLIQIRDEKKRTTNFKKLRTKQMSVSWPIYKLSLKNLLIDPEVGQMKKIFVKDRKRAKWLEEWKSVFELIAENCGIFSVGEKQTIFGPNL